MLLKGRDDGRVRKRYDSSTSRVVRAEHEGKRETPSACRDRINDK